MQNEIGPFCRMRGKAVIDNECVLGNFVEIKSSNIKDHVKLSIYLILVILLLKKC